MLAAAQDIVSTWAPASDMCQVSVKKRSPVWRLGFYFATSAPDTPENVSAVLSPRPLTAGLCNNKHRPCCLPFNPRKGYPSPVPL